MKDILPSALKQLIDFLEECEKELGIKYYLVGGLLVNIYSAFRTTQDIDFVVDLYSSNITIEEYVALLEKNNFNPLQDWETSIILAKDTMLLQYFDKNELIKLDNYLIDNHNPSKYKRIGPISLKNRVKAQIFGIDCWVASKEDYIISKLVFGGWQDYADALGCWMRYKETIDKLYLEKIGKELDILKECQLLTSGIEDPDEYFEKLDK